MHPDSTPHQLALFPIQKRCATCGVVKPIEEFGGSRGGRRRTKCRACWARCMREYSAAHREAVNRSKRESRRRTGRQYRATHAVQIRAWTRAWREKNKEHCATYHRAYKQRNRLAMTLLELRRIARKRANGGAASVADIEALYARQEGLCTYCLVPLGATFQIDHRLPVSRGGSSDASNLCLACGPCNRRKGALTDEEFRARDLS